MTPKQNKQLWAAVGTLSKFTGKAEAESIMRGFVQEVSGQDSTRSLSDAQARNVINRLNDSANPGRKKKQIGKARFSDLAERRDLSKASPDQLRMLEALAHDALKGETRAVRERGLRRLLRKYYGIEDLRFLNEDQVTPLKKTLIAIGKRNGFELQV